MVAAFGLNSLVSVWVDVDLQGAFTTLAAAIDLRLRFRRRIKNHFHIAQRVAVLTEQSTKLLFKLDLFLQFAVIFQCVQLAELLGQLGLKTLEFCEFAHFVPNLFVVVYEFE